MGGRRFRLGRHRKNAESKRQLAGKNKPGRPKKQRQSQTKPTTSAESTPSRQTRSAAESTPSRQTRSAARSMVPPPQSLMTLRMLYESLPAPVTQSWTAQYSDENKQLQLCKLNSLPSTSCQMLGITHTLCVQDDLTWTVFIHGNKLHQISNTPLSGISSTLSPLSLQKLISILDEACICPGNPDDQFLPMATAHKGVFVSGSVEEKAHLEKDFQVILNGDVYHQTIRTATCSLLVSQGKCSSCKSYRPQLRAMYSRWSKKPAVSAKYTNIRYLNTPQKKRKMKELQVRAHTAEEEVKKLRERIEQCAEQKGVQIQPSLNDDFLAIMTENNSQVEKHFPEGSFRRLFWDQQFQAAKTRDARQMRWHPCMIRWCLNLKLLSSAAYHSLRTSGFLKLPSERTLRDYTHFIKSKAGFSSELDQLLADESQVNILPEWKRHVILVLDEMKVKESLVFDKHETEVVGFVDMGDVNNELADLERECSTTDQHPAIATHMLVLMVRGVFTGLRFPYAHFPTTTSKAEHLFDIVWEAIERIEHKKLKVIMVCSDGASSNRKMFRMHGESLSSQPYNPVYKTTNRYSEEERPVFFKSDVPHLLKTTRNNWSHSFGHGCTRKLWVRGNSISWRHLQRLYDAKLAMSTRSSGLYLIQKLKQEHINLMSFSRMRVDLAAQVLSQSVANALEFYGGAETSETKIFVQTFDTFFDCLNVRNLDEHRKKRKPNLRPYRSPDDERLTWLENDFLQYLADWKASVDSRPGFTRGEKALMCLSKETIEGLHITVRSFVEVIRYLTTLPGVTGQYVLSECFSQDPLENYFGQLRARGGRCENPTVKGTLESAQSLRVQGSLAMQPVRGNSSRKRRLFPDQKIDETPLPKRGRSKK